MEKAIELTRDIYCAHMNQRLPLKGHYVVASTIADLVRASDTLGDWALKQCNGIDRYDAKLGRKIATWTDGDQDKCDAAIEMAEAKAIRAANRIWGDGNYQIEFQRDPRGCPIRIHDTETCVSSGDPIVLA